ncbi:MAG: methyltransferase domain-containing protein [Candidatus Rokubacteria bacterium]|nr:methyltransferase domain-containing protein [Candidatus Rokubacteria bacterium]
MVSPKFLVLLEEEDLKDKVVLDVGCGAGQLAFLLAPRCRSVMGIDRDRAAMIVAYLCMSDAIIARAGRALAPGECLAFVCFHVDQWRETGRPSRFAYDEARLAAVLRGSGFHPEHLEVDREVTRFDTVEEGLAAAVGLEDKWKTDGRWLRYMEFLEQGGRTLTRSHLIVKARRQ